MSAALSVQPEKLEKLRAPFPEKEIEWRVQRSDVSSYGPWAMVLAYVDARAVQERLDEVCGPQNWRVEYLHVLGGVLCKLSIRVNGDWITKEDGSPETNIEAFKGGISKALVRAASTWGIGRYLYRLESNKAIFVDKNTAGAHYLKMKDNKEYYWVPPKLPAWALPAELAERRPIALAIPDAPPADFIQMASPEPTPQREHPTWLKVKTRTARSATAPQVKRMFAIAYKHLFNNDDIMEMIKKRWGYESTSNLTAAEVDQLVSHFEANGPKENKDDFK